MKRHDYIAIFVCITILATWSLVELFRLSGHSAKSGLHSQSTVARVSQVRETSYIREERSQVWQPVKTVMDVSDGSYLATEEMSQLSARFGHSRQMVLGENSLLQMRQVLRRGRQDSLILHLFYGHVMVEYGTCTKVCPALVVRAAGKLVELKPGERQLVMVSEHNTLSVISDPTQMPLSGRRRMSYVLPDAYRIQHNDQPGFGVWEQRGH